MIPTTLLFNSVKRAFRHLFLWRSVLLIGSAHMLLGSFPTGSTTYYVATDGSDANRGNSAEPFSTIQRASEVVNPGDTVIVRDGVYSNASASGVGSKLVVVNRGGSDGLWVTFRSENKWGAVLDGLDNATAEAWAIAADYIRVEDFEMRYFSDDALSNFAGGQFVEIVGNHIHHIGRYCTDTRIGRDAIFIARGNVSVEQNFIHDIGRYAPGENGCIPQTRSYQNSDHGIYIDGSFGGADNVTIRDNIFFNVTHGWSIHVYPSAVDNLSILNNTFSVANPWRTGHIIFAAAITNSRIENNHFHQPNKVALNFYSRHGYHNVIIRNNTVQDAAIGDATPDGIIFEQN
jgi:hypothetical protein